MDLTPMRRSREFMRIIIERYSLYFFMVDATRLIASPAWIQTLKPLGRLTTLIGYSLLLFSEHRYYHYDVSNRAELWQKKFGWLQASGSVLISLVSIVASDILPVLAPAVVPYAGLLGNAAFAVKILALASKSTIWAVANREEVQVQVICGLWRGYYGLARISSDLRCRIAEISGFGL
jgi:hypothetical protein